VKTLLVGSVLALAMLGFPAVTQWAVVNWFITAQEEQIRSNERVQSALTMVGVPFLGGSASSSAAAQVVIAHLKGEQEAVRQAVGRNSCPTQESRVTTQQFRETPCNRGSL
jgi:hypothetical protein